MVIVDPIILKKEHTMTHKKHTELFEKLLVGFCQEEDPMKEMLQWITN